MPITPSDIEHKTFSTALRGYDLDEVDDFLDEIVVALRDLHGELTAARAKIAELEQTKGSSPAPAGGGDEAAVGRVLILAQQAADKTVEEARAEADQLLEQARAEAERTLSEARTEADSFEADREQRREAATSEMAELSLLVASVRNQLALLATSVADRLDEMDSTIESADLDAISEMGGLEGIIDEAGNGAEEAFAELTGAHEIAQGDLGDIAPENAELDLDTGTNSSDGDPELDMDSETGPDSLDIEDEESTDDESTDEDEQGGDEEDGDEEDGDEEDGDEEDGDEEDGDDEE
jgi:cell division initiation protein